MKSLEALTYHEYLFQEGTDSHASAFLGSAVDEEGASFRVWAPNAVSVSVVGEFNDWDVEKNPMEKVGEFWQARVEGAKQYDNYKYAIRARDGQLLYKADPYAYHSETRPGTASKLYDITGYQWHDEAWLKQRKKHLVYSSPLNIYEVDIGSWRRKADGSYLTYRETADLLVPYAKSMGYTHVEFMPLTEYPLDASWGYQCTGYFAATSRYGTPHDLMYLIDQCHMAGLGVILDWVPAHFPKDPHGLVEFDGTRCYEGQDPKNSEHPEWGTRIFDYARGPVSSFLISSALFWLEQYHVDGLRVDAVASMLYLDYGKQGGQWTPNRHGGHENLDAVEFFARLNQAAFGFDESILMIAEESTAWPLVTKPPYMGGLGFNLKWNMGWMNDVLHYVKLDPYFRQFNHRDLTFPLMYAFSENFILPLSHDEVVHMKGSMYTKMPGGMDQKLAGLRLLYAYMLASPGKKLSFMGMEFGQEAEWDFTRSLDWDETNWHPEKKRLQGFFKAAGQFYLENSELWEIDFDWQGFTWISPDDNERNVAAFIRKNQAGESLICIFNFAAAGYENYLLGVDEPGKYKEVLNTDLKKYGGSGVRNLSLTAKPEPCHSRPFSLSLQLAPLSAVFLRKR